MKSPDCSCGSGAVAGATRRSVISSKPLWGVYWGRRPMATVQAAPDGMIPRCSMDRQQVRSDPQGRAQVGRGTIE